MIVAYIQARGGSKRFPRKNLALWNGKPMVADAIEKAQASMIFDAIAVSSDDPEILQIAVEYEVLPLWRSSQASSDTATDDDVYFEVIKYFPDADIVCKLYPCIPLLKPSDIEYAYFVMQEDKVDGVFGVDQNNKDAGAFYMFRPDAVQDSIALHRFPWQTITLKNACDINTPEDLETAKRMAND